MAIAPTTYAFLQRAQSTSTAVEKLFSLSSKLLRKDRNFDVTNAKKCKLLRENKLFWQMAIILSDFY